MLLRMPMFPLEILNGCQVLSTSLPCNSKSMKFIINEVSPLDTGFFKSREVLFFPSIHL